MRIFKILENINSHVLKTLKPNQGQTLTNFNLVMLTRQAQSTPQMKRLHANIEEIFPFFFRVTFILKALPPLHLYPAFQLRLSFWRKNSDTTPTIISHVCTHFGFFRHFLGLLPTNEILAKCNLLQKSYEKEMTMVLNVLYQVAILDNQL